MNHGNYLIKIGLDAIKSIYSESKCWHQIWLKQKCQIIFHSFERESIVNMTTKVYSFWNVYIAYFAKKNTKKILLEMKQ